MKTSSNFKSNFIYIVALLHILLFTYAAVSKIMDFENFQTQLGQSPLLSAYAQYVSYAVIIVELMITFLLALPKFRILALYFSLALMSLFCAYIVVILNYTSYIPCSCGGILGKMSWTEHLIFNSSFVLICSSAILLYLPNRSSLLFVILTIVCSATFVYLLFISSEDIMQKQNPFLRRFAPYSADRSAVFNLQNYDYYFAGQRQGKIYLANSAAPLTILEVDENLKIFKKHSIQLNKDDYPFKSVKIKIYAPYFFLYDGSVPVIFRGLLSDWKATAWKYKIPYFTDLQPVSSNSFIFRGQDSKNNQNILGTLFFSDSLISTTTDKLLEKQIDGIFDTDGLLNYSKELQSVIYTYYYRNQFIVANSNLDLIYRGKTIDTTTKVNLKIVKNQNSGDVKLAAPPYRVNVRNAIFGNLLFNQSALRGQYESLKNWKTTSSIDVYDLSQNTYVSSFYIYNENNEKLSAILATSQAIYAIMGHQIIKYQFGKSIKSRFIKNK